MDEATKKSLQAFHKDLAGIAEFQNNLQAQMLAYRSFVVGLATLHRMAPDDGALRLEFLKDIAVGSFAPPVAGHAPSAFDTLALDYVRELIQQVEEAAQALQQSDHPN